MKIYLSGPMTGIEDYNKPEFNRVATLLREKGFDVVNPAEVEIENGNWVDYMKADIKLLMDCDTVAALNGWEKSRGALTEITLAYKLGYKFIKVETLLEGIKDESK